MAPPLTCEPLAHRVDGADDEEKKWQNREEGDETMVEGEQNDGGKEKQNDSGEGEDDKIMRDRGITGP